jgi:succinyl-diaminopimelate desuccinylase
MHAHFAELGLESEWIETAGHPIVFAESPDVPGRPTVLVYGHYDVQPPEPLDEWISPPFEPTVRDGNVYARGATDDKGQMFTHVKSAEAWLRTAGALPLKLKFLIEGEEEIGSEHLHAFVARHADRLACDCVVVSDTSQFGPGQPAITYGLRGIAFYQLRLTGPKQDLHSGTFGGAVTNPAGVLAKLLAALVDAQGRITVPHFYDDVVAISDEERRAFAELPYDEAAFMRQIGVDGLTGEAGYTALERRWGRPTCDVHGLYSGYTGEGAKTAIPAQASASFSFRLVPDQKPEKIAGSLRTMLERLCPPGIRMELESHHGARGVVVDRSGPYLAAAARAIEAGFGKAPVMIREGGSIPVVSTFAEHLGVDTLLLGWGLNDDNTHSPNEKFHIADFHRAIKASAYLWKEISGIASRADNASST